MSLASSQRKVFLRLVADLRPHLRRDADFPMRLAALFAANRAFGSRDRKLYRELLYTTLRYLPWIEPLLDAEPDRAVKIVAWLAADLPATHGFRATWCADWPAVPASVAAKARHLGADPAALLPEWLVRHCPEAGVAPNLDALHLRAPLWLRLQTAEPARVTDEFTRLGWSWRRAAILPTALELITPADVTKTAGFTNGLVEVQDLGSQLVLAHAAIAPGGHWLDACAGAGGKTLQLAALLGPAGRVDAYDIRASALRELAIRAARARAANITILPVAPLALNALYDGVLVDAPCSGTGTWRRSPHLKWSTTPAQIAAAAETQRQLLAQFARHVRPGGRLVYVTCSLSRMENAEVVAAFLAAHPAFAPEAPARTILPAEHDTDGFFVATLRRA
ncbi:MAG: hypothetical protein RLZZ15_4443 [Verrucomicrobiota bacterium]|jgi:16S rRNA (cytosine967-C5)-methyltransferase